MGRVEGARRLLPRAAESGVSSQQQLTYHDKKLGVGKVVLSRVTKGNVSTQH